MDKIINSIVDRTDMNLNDTEITVQVHGERSANEPAIQEETKNISPSGSTAKKLLRKKTRKFTKGITGEELKNEGLETHLKVADIIVEELTSEKQTGEVKTGPPQQTEEKKCSKGKLVFTLIIILFAIGVIYYIIVKNTDSSSSNCTSSTNSTISVSSTICTNSTICTKSTYCANFTMSGRNSTGIPN
jgi:hypothetical protein